MRILVVGLMLALASFSIRAEPGCLQSVIGSLYGDLEAIDSAGEKRLAAAIDQLSNQEQWNESQRSAFTLSLADNAQVDAAESRRTTILGEMFGLAQRGEGNCEAVKALQAEALELNRTQWDAALQQVQQRIVH